MVGLLSLAQGTVIAGADFAPTAPDALIRKGDRLRAERKYAAAERSYKTALQFASVEFYARWKLAGLYTETMKKHAEAVKELETILQTVDRPEIRFSAYRLLAHVLRKLQSYDRAIDTVRKALPLAKNEKDEVGCYSDLAQLHRCKWQHKEAISYQEQAVRLDPNNPEAHCHLGILYSKVADYRAALEQYELALKRDPRHVNTRICLAGLHVKMSQRERGIALIEQLRASGELNSTLYSGNLAWFYAVAKQPEECLRYMKLALENDLSDGVLAWARIEEDFPEMRKLKEFRRLLGER